jgi:hypothetical protein
MERRLSQKIDTENLVFLQMVQLNLVFRVGGLIWPNKPMPLYGVLMFPWSAGHHTIRMVLSPSHGYGNAFARKSTVASH